MNASMDTVSIEIQSVATDSVKAIDTLITSLDKLRVALKNVSTEAKGLKDIRNALQNATKIQSKVGTKAKSKTTKDTKVELPNAEEQLKNLNVDMSGSKMISSLTSMNKEMTKYRTTTGDTVTVIKKMKDGIESASVSVKKFGEAAPKDIWSNFNKSLQGVVSKIAAAGLVVKKLSGSVNNWVEESSSYVEAVNLFFTEMGNRSEEAYKWVNKFSTALYLDPKNIMQYMGSFNSLVEGLGVGSDNAYKMAKNLTQLTVDLASYKNLSYESAYDKLMSGIGGQIKGLKMVGVALSQNTLQELANELGIKQKVTTMNEAQKAELRYIQIMRTSVNWQADLGKTLTSTENIRKAATQQYVLLRRELGNIAAVIMQYLLPYFIAFTQILREAAVRLANFFGYKIDFDKYQKAETTLGKINTGVKDIGTSAGKTKNQLNTMLAPFDELNVVQEHMKSAGSGSGDAGLGSSGLGLDLPEYDALSKLTGELDTKVADAKKKLESLIPVIKTIVGLFAGMWAIKKLANFINALKTCNTAFSGLWKLLKGKFIGTFGSVITKFSDGYRYAKTFGVGGLGAILNGLRNLLSPIGKVSLTLGGMITSFVVGYKEMNNYTKGTESLGKAMLVTTGVTAGFAAAAFALVGWPAALGIGIAGLTGALAGYAKGLQDIETHNRVFDNQGVSITTLTSVMTTEFDKQSESIIKHKAVFEQLSNSYTTAKNQTDSARTAVDNFISSLELQDGKISSVQLGELSSHYDSLRASVQETKNAQVEYMVALIKQNAQVTNASNESTAQQIANYKAIAATQANYSDEYIAKEEEITKARYTGKISVEEYTERLKDLKVEYGQIKDTNIDTSSAVDIFNASLGNIDFKNVTETKTALDNAKESMHKNVTALEEYKTNIVNTNTEMLNSAKDRLATLEYNYQYGKSLSDKEKANLKGQIEATKKEIETYSTTMKTASADVDAKIKEIKGSYVGYLTGVYADLVSDGADTSKEFSGIMKSIKDEASSLKGIEVTGIGKKLKTDVIADIVKNKPEMVSRVKQELGSIGLDGGKELTTKFLEQLNQNKVGIQNKTKAQLGVPAAKGMSSGLNEGVESERKNITNAGKKLGDYAIEGTRRSLNWHSPSKVYEGAGRDTVQGYINGINQSKGKMIQTMTNTFNEMIKESNKMISRISFSFDSSKFQNSLDRMLGKLQTFANKFQSGVNRLLSKFTTSMNGISVDKDNKLRYTKMPYVPIPRFDKGGYPTKADLFYANENGIPEMVGRIGNRTAVANNDQITTAITNAIMTAFSNANFGTDKGTVVVNIGNKKVYEGMGEYINSESERYGTTYITI